MRETSAAEQAFRLVHGDGTLLLPVHNLGLDKGCAAILDGIVGRFGEVFLRILAGGVGGEAVGLVAAGEIGGGAGFAGFPALQRGGGFEAAGIGIAGVIPGGELLVACPSGLFVFAGFKFLFFKRFPGKLGVRLVFKLAAFIVVGDPFTIAILGKAVFLIHALAEWLEAGGSVFFIG